MPAPAAGSNAAGKRPINSAPLGVPPPKQAKAWHCSWCRAGTLCNWCGECGGGQLFSIAREGFGYPRGTYGCRECIRRKSGQDADDWF